MAEAENLIFISAGDPSGDIAGSHLIGQLKSSRNDLRFFGLGGRRMLKLGQRQIADYNSLAVLGFFEVARKILYFRKLMNNTVREIKQLKPKAVVLIDYPGFNLKLAKKIKPIGIPIIYYISPQIWAWGGKRIDDIKKLVDLMLLILPFEKEIYNNAGINNNFVGHYLFDEIESDYIKAPYNSDSNLISLLPGSRRQEVDRMLPVLIETAVKLSAGKEWRFVICATEGNNNYSRYLKDCPIPIEVVSGKTRELIGQSRLVITSSGTATLETGIIGRPMVVIYKTSWLTYLIARRLVKLDKIALVNITANKIIVPELIQHEATADKIAVEARRFIDDKEYALDTVKSLNSIADSLGGPGAAKRSAEAILGYINC
jgi:lipid-A-disaccharide synthase